MRLLALGALAFTVAAMPRLAAAEPSEHPEVSVTRTAQSGLQVQAGLSKNEYRYVEREVVETIQVPYSVSVPYEDWETYYVNEQRCDHRPQETCTNENVCRQEQVMRHECHNERRCYPDGHCTDEQVCRTIPVHENVCRVERQCHTRQVYECWSVSVPHTRQVTRYRNETHYRSETRRRTVTDRIFQNHWDVNVVINMPSGSELQDNERETLLVKLTGATEADAHVEINVDSPIFSYKKMSEDRNGGTITVGLELVAKYDTNALGEATITGLGLNKASDGLLAVRFEDKGIVSRVETNYLVAIGDRDTQQTIFEGEAVGRFGSRQIVVPVNVEIAKDHDLVIRLTVHRDGIVLSQPIDFTKTVLQVGQLDAAPYADVNGVREFSVVGEKEHAVLKFTDATPKDHKVETKFEIKLKRKKLLGHKTLAAGTFERKNLEHDGENTVKIDLSKFPGVTAEDLRDHAASGDEITVEVRVTRSSPRLGGNSPIRFEKSAKVKVQ